MTALPGRPHDFGAWVPTMTVRRLGDLGRPAGGRVRRQVLFASVPVVWLDGGSRHLSAYLSEKAGPTRCSPVVVQACFTADQIDRALTDPILARVPPGRVERSRRVWEAAGPGWVWLVAHCRVLWAQSAQLAGLS